MDLPGLKFSVKAQPYIIFEITSIRNGMCFVGWEGIKDRVPYATHWVKKYLERGDWKEKF